MKCTNCGDLIRPVVAIDIDGTLADYHGHFIAFLESYLNKSVLRQYRGGTPFKSWVKTHYGIDSAEWARIKLAYRQGAQKRFMPPYPAATAPTNAAMDGGAEVWITTTRPFQRLDGIDPDTQEWLRRNQIPYDRMIYDEDKLGVLAERVDPARVAAVLDDLPEQYDRAADLFGEKVPILSKTIWNDEVIRPLMVHGLDFAGVEIREKIIRWRDQ